MRSCRPNSCSTRPNSCPLQRCGRTGCAGAVITICLGCPASPVVSSSKRHGSISAAPARCSFMSIHPGRPTGTPRDETWLTSAPARSSASISAARPPRCGHGRRSGREPAGFEPTARHCEGELAVVAGTRVSPSVVVGGRGVEPVQAWPNSCNRVRASPADQESGSPGFPSQVGVCLGRDRPSPPRRSGRRR